MKSSLHIQVTRKGERSVLTDCFFSPPYKVADVTEDRRDGTLQLMLMSASPGILDGDAQDIKIDVGDHAQLCLHTQSYQRIYSMQHCATQQTKVCVGKNALLSYIPHPVVPHKASAFVADTAIYLQENASLTWGEIISCGRKLNGEVFLFSKYHSKTSVYYKGKVVLKENLLLQPAAINPATMGQLRQFTHQATLIFLNDSYPMEAIREKMLAVLNKYEDSSYGISRTACNGLMIRILGQKAEPLLHCLLELEKEIVNALKNTTAYAF